MYQLLTRIGKHDLTLRQAPALATSFLLASLFYRFGSFALELLAFMATWYVVDAGIQVGSHLIPRVATTIGVRRQRH